jgi:molybdopterin/thiamine biosynthesis adenylyltransferase
MKFDDQTIRRYSRQILLREIGGTGQQKLLASRVEARGVAAEYLRRAGVQVSEHPDDPRTAIDKWVTGSMAAVEEIKRILGQ